MLKEILQYIYLETPWTKPNQPRQAPGLPSNETIIFSIQTYTGNKIVSDKAALMLSIAWPIQTNLATKHFRFWFRGWLFLNVDFGIG